MPRRLPILLLLAWTLAACSATVDGGKALEGTYANVAGRLKGEYQATLPTAYAAVLGALKELNLPVVARSQQLATAEIKAMDGDTPVWIDLESASKDVTTIGVRHGTFGDEEASKRIHEAISARL